MNIVIAGATGYLGKQLTERLISANRHNDCEYKLLLIVRDEFLKEQKNISICNINKNSLHDCINNFSPDIIFCTTCCYEVNPEYLYKTVDSNYVFPAHLLQIAAMLKKPTRFFSIGTSLPPSLNLYSLTKKHFAELGIFFRKIGKVEFINILLESFYGIDEPDSRFITRSILQLKANQDLLLTHGIQQRDFIYIDDVIEVLLFLMARKEMSILAGDGYSIPVGTGISPSIREIILFLHDEIRSKSALKFGAVAMRDNEPSTKADLSVLRKLGFSRSFIHWQDGMRKVIRSIQ